LGSFILSDQTHSPWSWECATGENAAFPETAQNAIRFMGTEGSLDFPNLTLWDSPGKPAEWRSPLQANVIEHNLEDAYILQLEHFAKVIRGDELPRITADDATKSLRATVGVFEAASQGTRLVMSD